MQKKVATQYTAAQEVKKTEWKWLLGSKFGGLWLTSLFWFFISIQNWLYSSFTDRVVNIYKPTIILTSLLLP